MTCNCEDEHCEHWQAREKRFRAATDRITALPPVKYCRGCFRPLADCDSCDHTITPSDIY